MLRAHALGDEILHGDLVGHHGENRVVVKQFQPLEFFVECFRSREIELISHAVSKLPANMFEFFHAQERRLCLNAHSVILK